MTISNMRSMFKLAAALFVLYSTTAQAHMTRRCSWGHGYSSCTTSYGYNPTPNIIHVPPPDAEGLARIAKWEAFCKPQIVQRAPDYVRRYVYAHEGCDSGRSD